MGYYDLTAPLAEQRGPNAEAPNSAIKEATSGIMPTGASGVVLPAASPFEVLKNSSASTRTGFPVGGGDTVGAAVGASVPADNVKALRIMGGGWGATATVRTKLSTYYTAHIYLFGGSIQAGLQKTLLKKYFQECR